MISESFAFSGARAMDYLELTKPRLVSLVLLSTAVGFFLATGRDFHLSLLLITVLGTGLVAAGAMCLNQWMERREDARMQRTLSRPLPAGRLHPMEALVFGIIITITGHALLLLVNIPTVLLAASTWISYVFFYTPLKRKTSLCTLVGALPGAIPPLIGWAAAAGTPSWKAWILFAVVFLWQMPHFLSIAWTYRKDYEAAGFRMLCVEDPSGERVARHILLYAIALLPVSLLPSFVGISGPIYFWSALALGLGFLAVIVKNLSQLDQRALWIFRSSILYLAVLLILLMADKA